MKEEIKKGLVLFAVLSLGLLLACPNPDDDDDSSGPSYYTINAGDITADVDEANLTMTITDYTSSETNILIPETITGDGAVGSEGTVYTVTAIGDNAFYYSTNAIKLTEISLPASLLSIGNAAFFNNQLTELTIPTSLSTIGYNAFFDNQLTELTIPASVTSIGSRAFQNNNIVEVTFEGSATVLAAADVFIQNTIAGSITPLKTAGTIAAGTYKGESIGDFIYYLDSTTSKADILDYTGTQASLVIPGSVDKGGTSYSIASIGTNAFSNSDEQQSVKLASVSIPETVTAIGPTAFYENTLSTVTFAGTPTVQTLGSSSFGYNQLAAITIPASVTTIESAALADNPDLASITFAGGSATFTSFIGIAFNSTPLQNHPGIPSFTAVTAGTYTADCGESTAGAADHDSNNNGTPYEATDCTYTP